MPCKFIPMPGGGYAHIKFANRPRRRCRFCNTGWVDKLCDFPTMIDGNGKVRTCDAGMCQNCATSKGPDVDYCPHHKDMNPNAPGLPEQKTLF